MVREQICCESYLHVKIPAEMIMKERNLDTKKHMSILQESRDTILVMNTFWLRYHLKGIGIHIDAK